MHEIAKSCSYCGELECDFLARFQSHGLPLAPSAAVLHSRKKKFKAKAPPVLLINRSTKPCYQASLGSVEKKKINEMTLTCCPFTPLLEFDGPEFFYSKFSNSWTNIWFESFGKCKQSKKKGLGVFFVKNILHESFKQRWAQPLKLIWKDNFFCPPWTRV